MLPPHITMVASCYLLTSPWWPHVTSSHQHDDLILLPRNTMVTSCYLYTTPWWPHVASSQHHGSLMLPSHITMVTSCYLLTSPWWPHVTSSHHYGDLMLLPRNTMMTLCYLLTPPWWPHVTTSHHHGDLILPPHITMVIIRPGRCHSVVLVGGRHSVTLYEITKITSKHLQFIRNFEYLLILFDWLHLFPFFFWGSWIHHCNGISHLICHVRLKAFNIVWQVLIRCRIVHS